MLYAYALCRSMYIKQERFMGLSETRIQRKTLLTKILLVKIFDAGALSDFSYISIHSVIFDVCVEVRSTVGDHLLYYIL